MLMNETYNAKHQCTTNAALKHGLGKNPLVAQHIEAVHGIYIKSFP